MLIIQVSQETDLEVSMIVLLKRLSWKGYLSVTLKRCLSMVIAQVFQEIELWVDMIVLLERWSCKGHLSLTLGTILLCTFILGLLGDRVLWVVTIVLHTRWHWKGHSRDTGGAFVCSFFRSPRRQGTLSQYDSFIQKMVLERPFIGDEDSAWHVLFSGLPGDRVLWIAMLVLIKRWS